MLKFKLNFAALAAVVLSAGLAHAEAEKSAPAPALLQKQASVAPVTQLLNCSSIEGAISFTVSESYANGVYDHSGSVLTYEGITYEIGKNSTAYDQKNIGETNIATLFSVGLPNTNPGIYFSIDIPRSQTSLALNMNVATSILMGAKKFAASCHVL